MISFIYNKSISQETTKIFLQKKKIQEKTLELDYILENSKDSAYIDFDYSGDFGIVFHVYFKLKDNLPDGKYEIYVNHRLTKEAFFRNGLKDSMWTEYEEKGGKRVIPYVQDTVNGNVIDYYIDGAVRRITNIDRGNITWRETYSPEKVLHMKELFRNRNVYKILKYNQKGDVIEEKNLP
jgi:antitoxin component YwqK of YwqJK toxin-antitoxin module